VLTPDTILLTDRVAVVTGAAQGIGEACALALARFGAHVAVCDRNEEGLRDLATRIEGLGRRCLVGVLDVRDGEAVAAHLGAVAAEFGRVDVLVNNAGGGFFADFLSVNDKGQDALIRENFTSVTHFVRGCVPLMPAEGGSIITMTSIEAHRAAPGFAIYAAMKTGLMSLMKSLALELGPRRIRANCIAMDHIPTPGVGDLAGVRAPLDARGNVDDVAGACVFLASDLARFVTGSTVHVDGGLLAAAGWVRADDGSYTTAGMAP
jgi:NAD(P)-dependent dehydrogenase (short-subunit alcohol dehydrogenase family)